MFIKNGLKTNIRSRGRTALFFALIFMLSVVMIAAAGVRAYCLSAIESCDGEFRSIALIEYLGSEYPDPDEPDPDSRAAFDALDLDSVASTRGVNAVDLCRRDAVYFDGFVNYNKNPVVKDAGVIVAYGIGKRQTVEYMSESYTFVPEDELTGDEEVA